MTQGCGEAWLDLPADGIGRTLLWQTARIPQSSHAGGPTMPRYLGFETGDEQGSPPRTAVLLVNLGTPAAPTAEAVRDYLAEFLSDPRVVEWPRWLWWPVLHGYVLRTRPRRSAELYARIWRDDGSPLRVFSERLAPPAGAAAVSAILGDLHRRRAGCRRPHHAGVALAAGAAHRRRLPRRCGLSRRAGVECAGALGRARPRREAAAEFPRHSGKLRGQGRSVSRSMPRHRAAAGPGTGSRRRPAGRRLPVARGPAIVAASLHRRDGRAARATGCQTAGRAVPRFRGGLPGNAGGSRAALSRRVPDRGRRAVPLHPRAQRQRRARVRADATGVAASGGLDRNRAVGRACVSCASRPRAANWPRCNGANPTRRRCSRCTAGWTTRPASARSRRGLPRAGA